MYFSTIDYDIIWNVEYLSCKQLYQFNTVKTLLFLTGIIFPWNYVKYEI